MKAKHPAKAVKNEKQTTSWGGVSEWYDSLLETDDNSFQAKVILPNLLRIIEPKAGMNIVDIACGQGFFSRAFKNSGARVTACDISPELIDVAKENSSVSGIDYSVFSADNLDKAWTGKFDCATIILAIQNIENLGGAIAEASRVLTTDGRLILVLNHPAFRIPQNSSWEWTDDDREYRRIDSYMSDSRNEIDMNPGQKNSDKKQHTVSFHRPLQSYVKALNKSGLSITRLEEWISHKKSQPGPRAAEEDRMRKEIPMFLMIEATKK